MNYFRLLIKIQGYEEVLEYVKNVYYVLLTRGIKGTYLYVCDDDLREYLEQYIEIEQ